MFSVLIRPVGTLQSQYRPVLPAGGVQIRAHRRARMFGTLWSAVAAVILLIERGGTGS